MSVSLNASVACDATLVNQSSGPVRFFGSTAQSSGTIGLNGTYRLSIPNGSSAFLTFGSPVSINSNGNPVSQSTTSLSINGCGNSYTLEDPVVNPPYGGCVQNQNLASLALGIINGQMTEQAAQQAVRALPRQQVNTLICIPSIGNAYLIEAATIARYPGLVQTLIQLGADVNLTSDAQGRSIVSQLIQSGDKSPQVTQIIGELLQAGASYCG